MTDVETLAIIGSIIASCFCVAFVFPMMSNLIKNSPNLSEKQPERFFQQAYGAIVYVYPAVIISSTITFAAFYLLIIYIFSDTEVILSNIFAGVKFLGASLLNIFLGIIISEKRSNSMG